MEGTSLKSTEEAGKSMQGDHLTCVASALCIVCGKGDSDRSETNGVSLQTAMHPLQPTSVACILYRPHLIAWQCCQSLHVFTAQAKCPQKRYCACEVTPLSLELVFVLCAG